MYKRVALCTSRVLSPVSVDVIRGLETLHARTNVAFLTVSCPRSWVRPCVKPTGAAIEAAGGNGSSLLHVPEKSTVSATAWPSDGVAGQDASGREGAGLDDFGDGGPPAPPRSLMAFPPVARLVNLTLTSFNNLREVGFDRIEFGSLAGRWLRVPVMLPLPCTGHSCLLEGQDPLFCVWLVIHQPTDALVVARGARAGYDSIGSVIPQSRTLFLVQI